MTRTPRSRRPASLVAAASAAALLGALLPVTLVAAPAQAANGCLTEVPQGGGPLGPLTPGSRCDDQVPPEATLVSTAPAPNEAGFVSSRSLTFTFTGAHSDADTDPIGFECQFFNTAAAPSEWESCTSPVTYSDLADTTAVPYTFKVRAFDAADRGIDATAATNPLLGSGGAETDLSDTEDSPQSQVVKIDTRAPQAFIFNTPFDAETPSLPMLTTDSPTFRLASSEGNVVYRCDLDGRQIPCQDGNSTFRRLSAGTKVLSVSATDPAGNVDPDPATTTFTVPADIELPSGGKWRETASPRAFGGSYIETTAFGAKFAVEGTNVREVRLIATKRPQAGILRYKVPGNPNWAKVKLNSSRIERGTVIVLRNPSSKSFTGTMKFKTMSRGKLIEVDAIMLR
ncbi:MAG: hypothetical protein ACO1ON_08005 [Nocardioides sp.]